MKSRWSDEDAAARTDDLDLLVYTSRLLGADTSLVLAGGGNSSVKTSEVDVFGDPVDVLHVKGSGWDMASIEREGFAPLRLDRVARLAELPALSDSAMANELKAASLDAAAPAPSVESILHAILPFRFVLHTHADAVLALTNTPAGPALVREVYGTDVVVVPYVMPGFVLARLCAERFPAGRHEGTVGMVLLNHGLFTFAHDARLAYENHIDLVARALARVEAAGAGSAPATDLPVVDLTPPAVSPAGAAGPAPAPSPTVAPEHAPAPPSSVASEQAPARPPTVAGEQVPPSSATVVGGDVAAPSPAVAAEQPPSPPQAVAAEQPLAHPQAVAAEQALAPPQAVAAEQALAPPPAGARQQAPLPTVAPPPAPPAVPASPAPPLATTGWPAPPAPLETEPDEPGEPPGVEPPAEAGTPTGPAGASPGGDMQDEADEADDAGEDAGPVTRRAGPDTADIDAGAFGAGDPSAFGSGAGTPGGEILGEPSDDEVAVSAASPAVVVDGEAANLAVLRHAISQAAGQPMILRSATAEVARRFAARDDLETVAQAGPATPDHVLRTKRVPLLGRDVGGYVRAYHDYVERHRARLGDRALVPVDPAPRIVVDPELGVLGAGRRPADAAAAVEIYEHTMWIIERAADLGGYRAVDEAGIFDVEYWELEQAKLARQPAPAPLAGRVALVTGAASGIGRATARAMLDGGAAVVGLDLDASVAEVADDPAYAGSQGDAADSGDVERALAVAARAFGGLDLLVLNAGVFPPPQPVADLAPESWDRAMGVNAGAALVALRAAHPLLRLSPVGGSVVVVASKNVPAPGRGAAAYSASKAALTQLARVTALEWGSDGIRVNLVHPDAVFDTGLWDDDLIAERAASYGLTSEQYRRRNVLGAEVTSDHVAAAVVALCGPSFARTTGAQIAVDGGNDRVI